VNHVDQASEGFVGYIKKDARPPAKSSDRMSALSWLRPIARRIVLTIFSTGVMDGHDRSPVRRNEMISKTESEQNGARAEVLKPKAKRGRQECQAREERGPV